MLSPATMYWSGKFPQRIVFVFCVSNQKIISSITLIILSGMQRLSFDSFKGTEKGKDYNIDK